MKNFHKNFSAIVKSEAIYNTRKKGDWMPMYKNKKPFTADMHMHTYYSMDSLTKPEDILKTAIKKGLSCVAITDHNEIGGALQAQKIAKEKKLPLQVIIGEEVSCKEGDLLVYFVKKKIERGPLSEVLREVERQGAICCAAHPYDKRRHGIEIDRLPKKVLSQIHAIEAFNARCGQDALNKMALEYAIKNRKRMFAGSDAHHASEVGTVRVEFVGVKRLTVKNILSAKTVIYGKRSSKLVRFYSRYAVLIKKIRRVANLK